MNRLLVIAAGLAAALTPAMGHGQEKVAMPGEPVPAKFPVGIKSGNPLANLPANIRVISSFGERGVVSPDGKKVAFIGKTMGDAFEYDIASGRLRNLTSHMPHNGWTRVHYLRDGSYILIGTRSPAATASETRRERLELFWMDAQAAGAAVPLEQNLFEGVAVSRTSNQIAWGVNSARKASVFAPGAEGSSTLYVGDVEVSGGTAKLVNRRAVKTFEWSECVVEGQDFLPNDSAVLTPCYRGKGDGKYETSAISVALADGKVTSYPVPGNQYSEVEGIFPDGKRTFVECADDNHIGLDLCILELTPNKPRYTRLTRVMDYGNYRFSNPTVGPDGETVAFQIGLASDDYGAGRGILLMTGLK